jgi:hypothetical protein
MQNVSLSLKRTIPGLDDAIASFGTEESGEEQKYRGEAGEREREEETKKGNLLPVEWMRAFQDRIGKKERKENE